MTPALRSLGARLRRELAAHPLGYGVLAASLALGPVAIRFAFPEAPLGLCIFGGLLFGVHAACCAVPQKFL